MNEHFEVVVVGSGAGGGIIASELAERGRRVLLLETGPHVPAADHMRWEARATHQMWWPIAWAEPSPESTVKAPMPMFRGRCVGGTTTINTKVALRPGAEDYEKWYAAGGLITDAGDPFSEADLLPYIEHVERRLGVRRRDDWQKCVHAVAPAFKELGAELESVDSYTDANCMLCGSCLQGCPTNAGKSTLNTYIQPARVFNGLELRADCEVKRVLIVDRGDGPEATGVEYVDHEGDRHRIDAEIVVVAAGALATPGLLLRSGVREAAGDSPSSGLIGRKLGFHVARLVEGLFDEVQDAHMVYPITAHAMRFQRDEDGGYVVEAATVQDPIGFATALQDEDGNAIWGEDLVAIMKRYRYCNGLLTLVNDENTGTAWVDEHGNDRYTIAFNPSEQRRIDESLAFARDVLRTAGASRVFQTSILSTHVQGGCRMGSDPERSVVDAHCECHDVRRLFIGDGSVLPRTLSVNPSLTIMSLATRTAEYLGSGVHGYLGTRTAATA